MIQVSSTRTVQTCAEAKLLKHGVSCNVEMYTAYCRIVPTILSSATHAGKGVAAPLVKK